MGDQDFQILEKLLDKVEELRQRCGSNPRRGHSSLLRTLQRDLASYEKECRFGKLKGRARKRQSGRLFRRILSLDPDLWRTR